jgi:multidrug resistance efflux pump
MLDESNGSNRPAATLADRVRSLKLGDHTTRQRQRSGGWLPWLLCLAFAGAAGYFAWVAYGTAIVNAAKNDSAAGESGTTSTTSSAPSAPGAIASSGDIVLDSKGNLVPAHQIQISPKVGGLIMRLTFKEGDVVQKGAILAELETTDYKADYDRAHAAVLMARAKYEEMANGSREEEIAQAEAALKEAEESRRQLIDEVSRLRQAGAAASADEMVKTRSKLLQAEQKVEQLRQSHKLMAIGQRYERIDAALAELLQAKADRAKAKWRLDNCTLRAPVTGTILTKIAEEGNIVNQMAMNLKGSICDMADLSDMEVDLKIQERDISKVEVGQKCWVRAEAWPTRKYEGKVDRLMPIADRGLGAIPVRVKIRIPKEEEGKFLKPEMGVNVSFLKPGS